MIILDDSDRFRSRLNDLPFLMWVGECMSYGPLQLQKRLIALIDPDSVQRLATGKFSWEAAVIIGRLPERYEDDADRCPHCGHPISPGDAPDLDHDLADDHDEGGENAGDEAATEELAKEPAAGRLAVDPTSTTASRQDQPKVGRNEPCPCGSGKKFKRCCLA